MRPLAIALAENLVRLQKAMGTLNATVEEIASPGLADDEPTATPYAEDVLTILRERDTLLSDAYAERHRS
jgi:hypothetical protein